MRSRSRMSCHEASVLTVGLIRRVQILLGGVLWVNACAKLPSSCPFGSQPTRTRVAVQLFAHVVWQYCVKCFALMR